MRKYTISMNGEMGEPISYGCRIDGEDVKWGEVTPEDFDEMLSVLHNVSMNIYHKKFMAEHNECPTCEVKSEHAKDEENEKDPL